MSKKLAELNGERLWVYFDGNTAYLKHGDATLFSKTVNDTEMQITFEIQHGYDSLFDGDTNYASLIASKSRQLETFRKGNTFVYNIKPKCIIKALTIIYKCSIFLL